MESKLSEMMQSAMNSVKRLVEVNNIIGEPINTADGLTLVPISKVSFGFGGAGGFSGFGSSGGFSGGFSDIFGDIFGSFTGGGAAEGRPGGRVGSGAFIALHFPTTYERMCYLCTKCTP